MGSGPVRHPNDPSNPICITSCGFGPNTARQTLCMSHIQGAGCRVCERQLLSLGQWRKLQHSRRKIQKLLQRLDVKNATHQWPCLCKAATAEELETEAHSQDNHKTGASLSAHASRVRTEFLFQWNRQRHRGGGRQRFGEGAVAAQAARLRCSLQSFMIFK